MIEFENNYSEDANNNEEIFFVFNIGNLYNANGSFTTGGNCLCIKHEYDNHEYED